VARNPVFARRARRVWGRPIVPAPSRVSLVFALGRVITWMGMTSTASLGDLSGDG
jgi:hypothetical protein